MSAQERTELERELNTDAERKTLDRAQAKHEAAQRAVAAEREACASQVQAEHAEFIKSLQDGKRGKK
jgi:hypothetical protein